MPFGKAKCYRRHILSFCARTTICHSSCIQLLRFCQSASAPEDIQKHRLRQLPRIRVLQRRMITRKQPAIARYCILRSMPELQCSALFYLPRAYQVRHKAIEGNLAQTDHDPQPRKQSDFLIEKRRAVHQLFRQRLVVRRSTAPHARNQGIVQLHAIVTRSRKRLRSKPCFVQHWIKKIT